mgnify:CR=1 FL=1
MKHLFKIFVLGLMVLVSGCGDWLDIKPQTESKEDDLFAKEQGFKDALIGAYIQMKQNSLYGQNLTYTTLEYLAQHWNYSLVTYEENLSTYVYSDAIVEATFSSVYEQWYKVILSCNNILNNIDVFTKKYYELVKGEALAIRAFMHFDVLRLFGPTPAAVVSGERILPYVTEVSTIPNVHITFDEYIKLLEQDMLEAESLLAVSDPIIGDNTSLYDAAMDDFIQSRELRVNYYALKALMARFYLWIDQEDSAFSCAKEVIEAKSALGGDIFTLADKTVFLSDNKALTGEWIFGISVKGLADDVQVNFIEARAGAKLTKTKEMVLTGLYENNTADTRRNLWKDYTSESGAIFSYLFTKYTQEGLSSLPVMRISEMYLVAAEAAPTLEEGISYFRKFRTSRDLQTLTYSTKIQLQSDILKEYEKEFYGEGQMFYAYKRVNSPSMLWSIVPITPSIYKIPLPQDEISYLP